MRLRVRVFLCVLTAACVPEPPYTAPDCTAAPTCDDIGFGRCVDGTLAVCTDAMGATIFASGGGCGITNGVRASCATGAPECTDVIFPNMVCIEPPTACTVYDPPATARYACPIRDAGVDGGPPLPTPVCRPSSEDPTCMGVCTAEYPNCPPGYAVVCVGGGSRWERVVPPSGAGFCDVTDDSGVDVCVGGALPSCADGRRPVCFPPDPASGCGFACTGWSFSGCSE